MNYNSGQQRSHIPHHPSSSRTSTRSIPQSPRETTVTGHDPHPPPSLQSLMSTPSEGKHLSTNMTASAPVHSRGQRAHYQPRLDFHNNLRRADESSASPNLPNVF